MGRGKHFIGDFLPPDELEKFMETFKALKVGKPVGGQALSGRSWHSAVPSSHRESTSRAGAQR